MLCISVVAAASGCVGEAAFDHVPEDVAESQSAIEGGLPGPSRAATVAFVSGSASCSATILSDHWLLTAAHCIDQISGPLMGSVGKTGSNGFIDWFDESFYAGPMEFYVNPLWDGGSGPNDVALVHLADVGISSTARTKFYGDTTKRPWRDGSLGSISTYFEGAGDNIPGVGDWLRSYTGYTQSPPICDTSPLDSVVYTSPDRHQPGDSGGLWSYPLFVSGGVTQYVQYGVHSGGTWCFGANYSRAALLTRHLQWINDTMIGRMNSGVTRSNHYAWVNGANHRYHTYTETTRTSDFDNSTGYCLQAMGPGDYIPVAMLACTGGSNQKWTYTPNGTIKNVSTGTCLYAQVPSGGGNALLTRVCDGSDAQKFRFDRAQLRSKAWLDETWPGTWYTPCADGQPNGYVYMMTTCNGSSSQRWYF